MTKILKSKVFLGILSLVLIFGILAPVSATPVLAGAQPIKIVSEKLTNQFPKGIQFNLGIESEKPLKEIVINFQFSDEAVTNRGLFKISAGQGKVNQAEYFLEAFASYGEGGQIPPFADICYWYNIIDNNGNRLVTEKTIFLYEDIRFEWQTAKGESYTLYWYQNQQISQEVFQAASNVLERTEKEIGAVLERPIKVIVYSSWKDMKVAVGTKKEGVITLGQAHSPHDLVLILGHSDIGQLKKTVYHEIMHLVTHQIADGPYGQPPVWLNEGLSMRAQEIEDSPPYPYSGCNTGYGYTRVLIETINRHNQLIDNYLRVLEEFNTLLKEYSGTEEDYQEIVECHDRLEALDKEIKYVACNFSLRTLSGYSDRAEQIDIHYSNYWNIGYYLVEEYGGERLAKLLAGIKERGNYRSVFSEVYGFSVDEFEKKWHEHLGLKPLPSLPELPSKSDPKPKGGCGGEASTSLPLGGLFCLLIVGVIILKRKKGS